MAHGFLLRTFHTGTRRAVRKAWTAARRIGVWSAASGCTNERQSQLMVPRCYRPDSLDVLTSGSVADETGPPTVRCRMEWILEVMRDGSPRGDKSHVKSGITLGLCAKPEMDVSSCSVPAKISGETPTVIAVQLRTCTDLQDKHISHWFFPSIYLIPLHPRRGYRSECPPEPFESYRSFVSKSSDTWHRRMKMTPTIPTTMSSIEPRSLSSMPLTC